jgi:hypothetical protein
VGWDGAAASKQDDEEERQTEEEDLEGVQRTATGIEPVENGAGDVTHRSSVSR